MKKKLISWILVAAFLISGIAISVPDTADAAGGTWKSDSKGWWYSYSDGTYAKNQWLQYGGKWYHFGANGYMQTGWQ
ncbi:MAG: hypothetical protein IJM25_06380 [Eubacterium sp.]|nr:hypothetical protein [Eubacterium sp.]